MSDVTRVTVWGEYVHERRNPVVGDIYPRGMHEAVADGIRGQLGGAVAVRTATLDQPEHGLGDDIVRDTDVLTWWGHLAHDRVSDDVVARVHKRVLAGMGLLVLHSAHFSKIFRRLMGTSCTLHWREADDREIVWNVNPGHPIAAGIGDRIIIPRHEMYGEYFDVPQPDELVFISSFTGGEVFRGGCCFTRGRGRIFYFSPGHETYPVYHQPDIQRVIANAIRWAAPRQRVLPEPYSGGNAPTGWFER